MMSLDVFIVCRSQLQRSFRIYCNHLKSISRRQSWTDRENVYTVMGLRWKVWSHSVKGSQNGPETMEPFCQGDCASEMLFPISRFASNLDTIRQSMWSTDLQFFVKKLQIFSLKGLFTPKTDFLSQSWDFGIPDSYIVPCVHKRLGLTYQKLCVHMQFNECMHA